MRSFLARVIIFWGEDGVNSAHCTQLRIEGGACTGTQGQLCTLDIAEN
jgi:hypothetical protein